MTSLHTSTHRKLAAGLLFGFLGMLGGYGFSLLFPQIEVALYDWHVRAKSPATVDSSIVLITLDEQSPVSCGNGRWNSLMMSRAISALHQAGASVIAPAVRFEFPNPSECGDVLGNARLLEATKQAGNVVYPSFVQPLIANEARATGWFMLPPDDDGIFRRLSSRHMTNDTQHWPFGLAIASAYKNNRSLELPPQGLISFVGEWADQPFPTYSFTELFDTAQEREDVELSMLVGDKIVVIFPVTPNSKILDTPLEQAVPTGFLHANILNAALTQSWFNTPSWKSWFLRTFGILLAIVLITLGGRERWRWLLAGIVILTHFSMSVVTFIETGAIWPHMSSTIAIISTLLGIVGWARYEDQKKVTRQIEEASRQLAAMQENLVRKELVAEQLEEDLLEAQEHVHDASKKFESLSTTEENSRQRLQETEREAADIRQQLEDLQQELNHLREVSPVLPEDLPQTSDSDHQPLQKEAETFGILTCSPDLLKTFRELKQMASTDNPILILGETGTGKELFAQAAHQLSARSQGPFVSVNMAAIRPELFESELFGNVKGAFTGAISRRGFFETADRGSIFLDEIGELPLDLQAKLLRVLETGTFYRVGQSTPTQVTVRIIAATNRDLNQAVKNGGYREDLYYRLCSLVFKLPPLRERGHEDLRLLVQQIIADLSGNRDKESVQITQGAMDAIQAYPWPGNIRELKQALAQAVALSTGNVITKDDLRLLQSEKRGTQAVSKLSESKLEKLTGKDEIARREDAFVLSTLQQHRFDMQATARALKWDRSTVTQRLKGIGFQALVDHAGDVHKTAVLLAGNPSLEKIVELKLREYYKNLVSSINQSASEKQAISDCRRRLRNIPERHFPAIETLIRQHFSK